MKKRIAFIGAGQPRFFERVITETADNGRLAGAIIALAIAEKADSGVLEVAERHSIPSYFIGGREEAADREMADRLGTHDAHMGMLAGYRYLIGRHVLNALPQLRTTRRIH